MKVIQMVAGMRKGEGDGGREQDPWAGIVQDPAFWRAPSQSGTCAAPSASISSELVPFLPIGFAGSPVKRRGADRTRSDSPRGAGRTRPWTMALTPPPRPRRPALPHDGSAPRRLEGGVDPSVRGRIPKEGADRDDEKLEVPERGALRS